MSNFVKHKTNFLNVLALQMAIESCNLLAVKKLLKQNDRSKVLNTETLDSLHTLSSVQIYLEEIQAHDLLSLSDAPFISWETNSRVRYYRDSDYQTAQYVGRVRTDGSRYDVGFNQTADGSFELVCDDEVTKKTPNDYGWSRVAPTAEILGTKLATLKQEYIGATAMLEAQRKQAYFSRTQRPDGRVRFEVTGGRL